MQPPHAAFAVERDPQRALPPRTEDRRSCGALRLAFACATPVRRELPSSTSVR
jgi:hypothetical protein